LINDTFETARGKLELCWRPEAGDGKGPVAQTPFEILALGLPRQAIRGIYAAGALVRRNSVVEFQVISGPGEPAPHANSMDRRTGSTGSTLGMEPGREPVRGAAQRDSVLLSKGLAQDPAHAARRMTAMGKCLRLCW